MSPCCCSPAPGYRFNKIHFGGILILLGLVHTIGWGVIKHIITAPPPKNSTCSCRGSGKGCSHATAMRPFFAAVAGVILPVTFPEHSICWVWPIVSASSPANTSPISSLPCDQFSDTFPDSKSKEVMFFVLLVCWHDSSDPLLVLWKHLTWSISRHHEL